MCSASGLPAKRMLPRHGGIRPIIVFSKRALAGAAVADDGEDLAAFDLDADAALHRRAAVADVDVVDRDARHRRPWSDAQRVRADGEHGVERDDGDDRVDDRAGRRRADAGGAARRAQALVAADQRDHGAEHERLQAADREVRAADRVLRLREVRDGREVRGSASRRAGRRAARTPSRRRRGAASAATG